MDRHYYEQLRDASEDDFEAAINTPEHALYDILWDLFETVVIEPAEVFDSDFDSHNRFRYIVDAQVTMEFLPDINYFEKRLGPDVQYQFFPYKQRISFRIKHKPWRLPRHVVLLQFQL